MNQEPSTKKPVGVLALQGDFKAHIEALLCYGFPAVEIRKPSELDSISGLVLPGGESSTLLHLLDQNFRAHIKEKAFKGLPILATCAGGILIAETVLNPSQESLSLLEATLERNAYGRQINSFITEALTATPEGEKILSSEASREGIFIRAPRIVSCGPEVIPLLLHNDEMVLIKKGRILLASFHPELSKQPHVVYTHFIELLTE
jgi:pyridoxal 5'-phosphate synthase pdxT subunit